MYEPVANSVETCGVVLTPMTKALINNSKENVKRAGISIIPQKIQHIKLSNTVEFKNKKFAVTFAEKQLNNQEQLKVEPKESSY